MNLFHSCAHIVAHTLHACVSPSLTGDFEFYKIGGKYYDCEAIQEWLARALHVPMPATVDSAAIAGMIDLLRVQGCFALSVRYAVCFELVGDARPTDSSVRYPTLMQYEAIGKIFEKVLDQMVMEDGIKTLEQVSASVKRRTNLCNMIKDELIPLFTKDSNAVVTCLKSFVTVDEEGGNLDQFVKAAVDAFFDNDLFNTTRVFLENAKGSFGLCVTTSLDAHRQVAMAAKGQTLCIAFYPRKGMICYGSEQAAVKVRSVGWSWDVFVSTANMMPTNDTLRFFPSVMCRLGSTMRHLREHPSGDLISGVSMKTRSVSTLMTLAERLRCLTGDMPETMNLPSLRLVVLSQYTNSWVGQ